MDRVEQIKKLINEKLKNLKELGSEYSEEKINILLEEQIENTKQYISEVEELYGSQNRGNKNEE